MTGRGTFNPARPVYFRNLMDEKDRFAAVQFIFRVLNQERWHRDPEVSFSGIVYIDGMESSKERMDNLNPDRIASMNVYKGNEAIAKFGEKGRNGVIEIKLKK